MLAECPHCHKHAISRWRDAWRWNGYAPLICPNCHTPVKVSNLLRIVLTLLPVSVTMFAVGNWEPPPSNWVMGTALSVTGIIGLLMSYMIPRYREVKAKGGTPPVHVER